MTEDDERKVLLCPPLFGKEIFVTRVAGSCLSTKQTPRSNDIIPGTGGAQYGSACSMGGVDNRTIDR